MSESTGPRRGAAEAEGATATRRAPEPQAYGAAETIRSGHAVLGFELGSTRIKATLIGPDYTAIASGSYAWENQLVDGVWTYDMDDVWRGVAAGFADLKADIRDRYGLTLERIAGAGFSGMMHGYLAVNDNDELLVPFRTWRNNITAEAADKLTELFNFAIPQRWSIAHLYQAILNAEEHLRDVRHITTLAGYVHRSLSGRWAIGTCEASGMFPVDPETQDWDAEMMRSFDELVAREGLPWRLRDLLPDIVPAGELAGTLSPEGAALLDPDGDLQPGVPLSPPEGDAGTGMVATNSVKARTGNVSAGTSAFAMVVIEEKLARLHREIDIVLTPDGKQVAMAHSNNCSSDFDAWMGIFGEAAQALGIDVSPADLYSRLMPLALQGDPDAGGILSYGYISGEHVTGFTEGRPLVARKPDGNFTLANFIRAHLFSALGALRAGLEILTKEEGVQVDVIRGHGGFFKTPGVGQRIMAAATKTPVSLLDTAGEGGAWGMALLAAFTAERAGALPAGGGAPAEPATTSGNGQDKSHGAPATSLVEFLERALAGSSGTAVDPDPADVEGFDTYFARYSAGLSIEREAVSKLQ